MRNSLDYAGLAQLWARSPIMRKIMRAHNRIIQPSLVSYTPNTRTQPFNSLLSRTIQVGQKKHSPTRAHPGHQTSFINFLHLLRSEASSLKVLFHNLCPGPLWSTSWSATLYFILHTSPGHYLLYLNVPYQNIKYERVKYSHNSCRFAAIVPVNIGSFIAALIHLMLMPFKWYGFSLQMFAWFVHVEMWPCVTLFWPRLMCSLVSK